MVMLFQAAPERQTKEQTHPNNLKPAAEGALQVTGSLSDPPSKYKKILSPVTDNNHNCLSLSRLNLWGQRIDTVQKCVPECPRQDLIYTGGWL